MIILILMLVSFAILSSIAYYFYNLGNRIGLSSKKLIELELEILKLKSRVKAEISEKNKAWERVSYYQVENMRLSIDLNNKTKELDKYIGSREEILREALDSFVDEVLKENK